MEKGKLIIVVLTAIDISIFTLAVLKISKVIKRYLELKSNGITGFDALEQSLARAIPGAVAKIAVMELRIYHTIFRSVFKRSSASDQFLTKHDSYKFFMIAIAFISALETGAIEIAVPDKYLTWKIILLVLTVWAWIYLTGLYLAVAQIGHRLRDDGIELQVGLAMKGFVPYNGVESVVEINKTSPAFKMGPYVSKDEPGVMYAMAGENSNVALYLNKEVTMNGIIKEFKPVSVIYLSLEEPKKFIQAVNERIQNQAVTN
ncbi:MAG: hypothetical protein K6T91_05590 [Firmicutes bacterium]|nr:hypothetical protein [Bacillota bacterium]